MSESVRVDDRDIWLMVASFVLLSLAVGLLVVNFAFLRSSVADARDTHAAACSYRQFLARQAHEGEQFLETHPDGIPSLGISAGQLQRSITAQQAAASALSDLQCP